MYYVLKSLFRSIRSIWNAPAELMVGYQVALTALRGQPTPAHSLSAAMSACEKGTSENYWLVLLLLFGMSLTFDHIYNNFSNWFQTTNQIYGDS